MSVITTPPSSVPSTSVTGANNLESLENSIEAILNEIKGENDKLKDKKAQLQQLKTERSTVAGQLSDKQSSPPTQGEKESDEDFGARQASWNQGVNDLQARLDELDSDISRVQGEIGDIKQNIQSLESTKSNLESQRPAKANEDVEAQKKALESSAPQSTTAAEFKATDDKVEDRKTTEKQAEVKRQIAQPPATQTGLDVD